MSIIIIGQGKAEFMWDYLLQFLISLQTWINGSIAGDLKAFSQTRDWVALVAVLPLGITFGAIHALTPGHSKTILASYLAGSPYSVVKGMSVATILALTHVFSAVVIAVLALPLVSAALGSVGRAPLLEDLSRMMLATIGLWMIVRALRTYRSQHKEGVFVAVIAGLVPCPLTLFVMVMAISRGIPEAGLVFAIAMMLGVAFTLCLVACLTIFMRDYFALLLNKHGTQLDLSARWIEVAAGSLLLFIGVRELLFR